MGRNEYARIGANLKEGEVAHTYKNGVDKALGIPDRIIERKNGRITVRKYPFPCKEEIAEIRPASNPPLTFGDILGTAVGIGILLAIGVAMCGSTSVKDYKGQIKEKPAIECRLEQPASSEQYNPLERITREYGVCEAE